MLAIISVFSTVKTDPIAARDFLVIILIFIFNLLE